MKSRARKARTRIRRPRYVSLRLQLSPAAEIPVPDDDTKLKDVLRVKPRMKPPPPMEEKLEHDQSNMAARLFSNMDGCGVAAATLTEILDEEDKERGPAACNMQEEEEEERGSVSSCWGGRSSTSGTGATSAGSRQGSLLERAALRSSVRREDEDGQEEEEMRWVRMSEVVAKESGGRYKDQEEVSSCVDQVGGIEVDKVEVDWRWWWPGKENGGGGGMLLKLNYGEVMDAWGDRGGGGPFCWDFEESLPPQTVPDLQTQQQQSPPSIAGVAWTVPVDNQSLKKISGSHQETSYGESEPAAGWGTRSGQREASLLRYKEKRMNRLFSKRIRYQVRKLNAEKRPRIKGRFVKKRD